MVPEKCSLDDQVVLLQLPLQDEDQLDQGHGAGQEQVSTGLRPGKRFKTRKETVGTFDYFIDDIKI